MRLLHLGWPHLPLRLERESRPLPDQVVLGGHPWDPGRVLDCSLAARRQGVRRGMSLAAAHALAPDAEFLAPDPDRYRAAAEAALDALSAFAPYVEGEADPAGDGFGGAFLGIDGLERLWGEEPVLLGRIAAALAPHVPGPIRAGIAGTRFGAIVAAVIARERLPGTDVTWRSVPGDGAGAEAAFLAPLPVTLLPATAGMQERLRVLGVRQIGTFATLPRAAVLARFGAEGGFLHDLANGRDGRRIVPRKPAERLRAEAEIDPPVESLEPLRFVLHRLAEALCGQLAARGAGATRVRLEAVLGRAADRVEPSSHAGAAARVATGAPIGPAGHAGSRPRATPSSHAGSDDAGSTARAAASAAASAATHLVEQALPGPTAMPGAVERLLLSRLEADPPGGPVERLSLELDGVVPDPGRQLGLFEPQAARAGHLEWQLADLVVRFGEGRVLRAFLRDPEARLPEARIGWSEAATAGSLPRAPGPPSAAHPAPPGTRA